MERKVSSLKMVLSDQNLDLLPDYEVRVEVLKELGFVDQHGVVGLKGRVACEVYHLPRFPQISLSSNDFNQIASADELILTELILDNTLAQYESEEIVAILSVFIFPEKSEGEPFIPLNLQSVSEESEEL